MKIVRTYTQVIPGLSKFDTWVTKNNLTLRLSRHATTYKAFITNGYGATGTEVLLEDKYRSAFIGFGDTEYEAIELLIDYMKGKWVVFFSPGRIPYKVEYPSGDPCGDLCVDCGFDTQRSKKDSLWVWAWELAGYAYGPLCEECYTKQMRRQDRTKI